MPICLLERKGLKSERERKTVTAYRRERRGERQREREKAKKKDKNVKPCSHLFEQRKMEKERVSNCEVSQIAKVREGRARESEIK